MEIEINGIKCQRYVLNSDPESLILIFEGDVKQLYTELSDKKTTVSVVSTRPDIESGRWEIMGIRYQYQFRNLDSFYTDANDTVKALYIKFQKRIGDLIDQR